MGYDQKKTICKITHYNFKLQRVKVNIDACDSAQFHLQAEVPQRTTLGLLVDPTLEVFSLSSA